METDLAVAILLGVAALVVAIAAVSWPLAYPNASTTIHRCIFWGGLAVSGCLVVAAVFLGIHSSEKTEPLSPSLIQPQQAEVAPNAAYSLTDQQQKQLLKMILPLKGSLQQMVINRSSIPGGDVIMMQLAQVFDRAGIYAATGFQEPVGPNQVGLFVCVPDMKHIPGVAIKLQKALQTLGFPAPLAQLPANATQNTVVIFAGPEPL